MSDEIKAMTKVVLSGKSNVDYLKKQGEKRFAVWREAAEKGLVEGQHLLGRCYQEGVGVVINVNEAVRWYRKAAEQGFPVSQHNLARATIMDGAVCRQTGLWPSVGI